MIVRPKPNLLGILFSLKGNLSKHPPALQYKLVSHGDVPSVEWQGRSLIDPSRGDRENPRAFNEWLDFLKGELSDGAMPSEHVRNEARKLGLAWPTFNYYKRELGITSKKHNDGHWHYAPPREWPTRRRVDK